MAPRTTATARAGSTRDRIPRRESGRERAATAVGLGRSGQLSRCSGGGRRDAGAVPRHHGPRRAQRRRQVHADAGSHRRSAGRRRPGPVQRRTGARPSRRALQASAGLPAPGPVLAPMDVGGRHRGQLRLDARGPSAAHPTRITRCARPRGTGRARELQGRCAVRRAVPGDLTPRQHAVARLLSAGHKDEEISACLGVSVRTVRQEVAMLLEQLGASTRFAAGTRYARILESHPAPWPLPGRPSV